MKTEKNWAQNEAALHSWKDKWLEHAYLWPGKKYRQSHRKHADQCNPAVSEDRELAKGYPLTLTALWNMSGNATSKGLTKQNSTFREQSSNMWPSQELKPVEHCIHSSRMVSGILGARTGCRFQIFSTENNRDVVTSSLTHLRSKCIIRLLIIGFFNDQTHYMLFSPSIPTLKSKIMGPHHSWQRSEDVIVT